jgi:1-deoxy-D-xylulose-5-phosphate reductoisomerase
MKKIAILGSTGSVGKQLLDVVNKNPDKLEVFALSANNNIEILQEQIRKYRPKFVGVCNEEKGRELARKINTPVFYGETASIKIARLYGYDTLVNCLVGLSGIRPTLEAIKNKKHIALANKETLVAAGEIILKEAKRHGVKIIPIDSEHSAIFQCLNGEDPKNIRRLILTCSGGAFHGKARRDMENATVREALDHKTWQMGEKITIDSATLMNKGFEIIEAIWLFGIPAEKIKVVIHPQSVIHSMVEYSDGSTIAQISEPDLRLPIQYALSYPDRWQAPIKSFNFSQDLTFIEPDLKKFPCLAYAYQAAKKGGTLPAIMNAANDFMVAKFLARECGFLDIERVVKKVMDGHKIKHNPKLQDIEEAISWATQKAGEIFGYLKNRQ